MSSISFEISQLTFEQQEQIENNLQLQQLEQAEAIAKLLTLIENLAAPMASLQGITNPSIRKLLNSLIETHNSEKRLPPNKDNMKLLLALFNDSSGGYSTNIFVSDKNHLQATSVQDKIFPGFPNMATYK